jgi:hypothetical protein
MLKMINKTACTESAVELKWRRVSKKREFTTVNKLNNIITNRNI